jgi:hypothetical protein
MTTFYIYSPSHEFLGLIEAADMDSAKVLASVVFEQPHEVFTFRLTYNLKLAA